MARLRHGQLRRFASVSAELMERLPEGMTVSNFLLGAVARLIPLDRVSYNEVDRDSQGRLVTAHSWNEASDPSLIASLNRFLHEHPGFARANPAELFPAPSLISDHLSQRQFRQLGLYQDHFRLHGIHYQLGVSFAVSRSRRISFGLNRRSRDFSEDDRLLLGLFRPHLAATWRRRQAELELAATLAMRDAALTGAGVGIILLDAAGEEAFRSDAAAELLSGRGSGERILAWARGMLAGQPPASARLDLERDGDRLAVLFTRATRAGEWHVVRLTQRTAPASARLLQSLGLARREAEVLFWLAQGKRNSEIATICGMQSTTVGTHLRTIFGKLGVETRTAAAAMAWEILTGA